jgi:hypothetical protein
MNVPRAGLVTIDTDKVSLAHVVGEIILRDVSKEYVSNRNCPLPSYLWYLRATCELKSLILHLGRVGVQGEVRKRCVFGRGVAVREPLRVKAPQSTEYGDIW